MRVGTFFRGNAYAAMTLLLLHEGGTGCFIAVAAVIRAGAGLHMNGARAAAVGSGVIGAVFDVAPDVIAAFGNSRIQIDSGRSVAV